MDYFKFNRLFDELNACLWQETMFANLQWHYCEEMLYALRLDHGTNKERLLLIKARSPTEAISIGVLDMNKKERV